MHENAPGRGLCFLLGTRGGSTEDAHARFCVLRLALLQRLVLLVANRGAAAIINMLSLILNDQLCKLEVGYKGQPKAAALLQWGGKRFDFGPCLVHAQREGGGLVISGAGGN